MFVQEILDTWHALGTLILNFFITVIIAFDIVRYQLNLHVLEF
jgi:hypothetical protein